MHIATRANARRAGAVALGTVLGLALVRSAQPEATSVPAPDVPLAITAPVLEEAREAEPPISPARLMELSFVLDVDNVGYMKLADLDDASTIPHGPPRETVSGESNLTAIAAVRVVPEEYRSWLGRHIKVDNTCEAAITGFALIARLTGDPGYAGLPTAAWNARTIFEHGGMILAAKLDGCRGEWARDAALPPVVIPQPIENPALADKARALFMASEAAKEGAWDEESRITVDVFRHPKTGATWVSVFGRRAQGCGDETANVWGLFRLDGDALVPAQLRAADDLDAPPDLIDIDGDGDFEMLATPWPQLDTVLELPNGDELDRDRVPFFGCPC